MRTKKKNETPKRIIQSDSTRHNITIVEVPVSDNPDVPNAIINSITWNKLMSMGMWPKLSVTPDGYVIAYSPAKAFRPKRLARLIANAYSHQEVRVKDGNELNLLEDNLEIINPDPVTNDREEFLPNDGTTYHHEVEYRTKGAPAPKPYNDAEIIEALARNPNYQDWLHKMKENK